MPSQHSRRGSCHDRPGSRRRRAAGAAVALALAAGLLGSAPAAGAAASSPPGRAAGPAYTAILGLEYAPRVGNAHVLDLYLPARSRGPAPVVIWSAGSAWLADNGNQQGERLAEQLAPHGYAVAAIAVRSSTQAAFPAQVNDGKAAIRWLRQHARRYRLDPRRFAAMGNSSGGWLAAMLGVTGGVRALEGTLGPQGHSSRVQAVIDLYGPTDFLRMDEHMLPGACAAFNRLLGLTDCHNDRLSPESRLVGCAIQTCPAATRRADPVRYVSRDDPPFMIVHGTSDPLVPHNQSELLLQALRRACGDARFVSALGRGHEHEYLDETGPFTPRVTRSTRGCGRVRVSGGPPLTWDALARFLDRALDRHGRGHGRGHG